MTTKTEKLDFLIGMVFDRCDVAQWRNRQSIVPYTAVDDFGAASVDELYLYHDGGVIRFWHPDQCCESVNLVDVAGDLGDLLGSPIVDAEVVATDDDESFNKIEPGEFADEHQWTYYKLSTVKGTVVLRWYGESNGYYSMGVRISDSLYDYDEPLHDEICI